MLRLAAVLLLSAVSAWARPDPMAGPDNTWTTTVIDTDIDTTLEIVDADTGYTAMAVDTTISFQWLGQSAFDSLQAGTGVSDPIAIWLLADSTDETSNANDLSSTGTVTYIDASFGDGASPGYNGYLSRTGDTDFGLYDEWSALTVSKGSGTAVDAAVAVWPLGKGDEVLGAQLYGSDNAAGLNVEANATTGWTNSGMAVFSSAPTYKMNGSYSMHAKANGPGDLMHTNATVVVGRRYRVSLYYYGDNFDATTGVGVKLGTSANDATYNNTGTMVVDETWTLATHDLTATATGLFVTVFEGGDDNDMDVYIDALSIKEISANDVAGTYDGTGGGTYTTDHDGLGGAMVFNGTATYVNIDTVLAAVGDDTQGTIACWVQSDDGQIVDKNRFVVFGDTDGPSTLRLVTGSTGLVFVEAKVGSNTQWLLSTSAAALANGATAWTHLAIVQDGVSPVLYVNGAIPAQALSDSTDRTVWLAAISLLDNARIGCRNYNNAGNSLFMDGNISDVRIYSTALSAADIALLADPDQRIASIHDGQQAAYLEYTDEGFIRGVMTWDNGATGDTLVSSVDVYDGTYHQAALSWKDYGLRLQVDKDTLSRQVPGAVAHYSLGQAFSTGLSLQQDLANEVREGLSGWWGGGLDQMMGADILRDLAHDPWGVVAWWPLAAGAAVDGNTMGDESGNGYDSDFAAVATYGADHDGISDAALVFSGGATSFVTVATAAVTKLKDDTQGTIALWVKPDDGQGATDVLIAFSDASTTEGLEIQATTTGLILAKCTDATIPQWSVDTDAAQFPNGATSWTHVAVVQDGTSPVIYVNGVAVAQAFTVSTDKTDWLATLAGVDNGRIGCNSINGAGNANLFDGNISDVRIYSRALSPAEVLKLTKSHPGHSAATVTHATDQENHIKGAMVFNGSTNYVVINSVLADVRNDTQGTWAMWVKPDDGQPAAPTYIASISDTDGNQGIGLTLRNAPSEGRIRVFVTLSATSQWQLNTDAAVFPNGATSWTHLAVVQDGVSPMLYVDGVAPAQTVTQVVDGGAWIASIAALDNARIGCLNVNSGGNTYFFDGDIADTRLYSRALSAAEIATLADEHPLQSAFSSAYTINSVGQTDMAMVFDGTDYCVIDSVLSEVRSDTQGSWSLWIKPDDGWPAASQYPISFGDASANEDIAIFLTTAGKLTALAADAGVSQWALTTNAAVFDNDAAGSVWKHVVLVQNGTSPVLYVDSVAVAQTFGTFLDKTDWFATLTGLDKGRIGDIRFNSAAEASFFSGDIADVRIYSKALTQADVGRLYKSAWHGNQLEFARDVTVLSADGGTNLLHGVVDETYILDKQQDDDVEWYIDARESELAGNAADTAIVWVNGIKQDSTRAMGFVTVPLAGGVTDNEFMGLEQAWLDSEMTQIIVGFPTGYRSTLLDSIPAGQIWNPVAHHYTDKREWEYIESVTFTQPLTTTGEITWEVRMYPDLDDARAPTNGYIVLCKEITRVRATDTQSGVTRYINKSLGAYSYLSVWAKGSVNDLTGSVIIRGKRQR